MSRQIRRVGFNLVVYVIAWNKWYASIDFVNKEWNPAKIVLSDIDSMELSQMKSDWNRRTRTCDDKDAEFRQVWPIVYTVIQTLQVEYEEAKSADKYSCSLSSFFLSTSLLFFLSVSICAICGQNLTEISS